MNPKADHIWQQSKVKDEENYCWRGKPQSWKKEIWGFDPRGLGDVWYITLRMIILTNDKSIWAERALLNMLSHMMGGKRWPDEYNNEHMARNWFEFKWTGWLYKLGLRNTRKYRSQKSMTRDPWIMLYSCAIHLGIDPKTIRFPQWWLYRPKVWQWIRALKGKPNIYRFLDRFTPKKRQDFVYILDQYMRNALKSLENSNN